MIEVREATFDEISEIRQVAISSYVDKFSQYNTPENMEAYLGTAYTLEAMQKEFSEPRSKLMVAIFNNRIAGFVRVRETDEVKDYLGKNTLELQRLYVLTSAQGKSIGDKLMNAALEYAIMKKYEWMWLGVWEQNFGAQKFYRKYGFEKFSEHTFWMGDDPQVDWLLKKKL